MWIASSMTATTSKRFKMLPLRPNPVFFVETFLLSEDEESWDDGQEDDWTDDEWGEDEGWGEEEEW